MKTTRLASFVAAFGLLAFTTAGCAEKAKNADSSQPAAKNVVAAPAPAPAPPPAPAPDAPPAVDTPEVAFARWSELKGYTYDQRDLFLAGIKGLEARVDALITELAAKRASMDASNTSTRDWDFAMQEMGSARTNLKSTNADIAKAPRETWDQQKDKVGLAWVRAQDAYAKVKSSTTN